MYSKIPKQNSQLLQNSSLQKNGGRRVEPRLVGGGTVGARKGEGSVLSGNSASAKFSHAPPAASRLQCVSPVSTLLAAKCYDHCGPEINAAPNSAKTGSRNTV